MNDTKLSMPLVVESGLSEIALESLILLPALFSFRPTMRHSALLMLHPLRWWTCGQFLALMAGLMLAGKGFWIAGRVMAGLGEVVERSLFFRAAAPRKMPGSFT